MTLVKVRWKLIEQNHSGSPSKSWMAVYLMIGLSAFYKDLSECQQGKEIGHGTCGIVYHGVDKASRAPIAIKKIQDLAKPDDQRSLIREIIVPLRLNLPGIVKLIGFRLPDNVGDPAIIITEFMPNGTLEAVLKDRLNGLPTPHFGPTEFSKAVFGIAATMAQVHANRAIHRDLKPGNVFMDQDWEPRIADFGLAKVVTTGMQMTMAIGSPLFMAPELLLDDETYDFSVDVFAYGVLLYTAFTSRTEFDDGSPAPKLSIQVLRKVADGGRLKWQPEIPEPFWKLIVRCWDQVPPERPSFADIVKEMRESDAFTIPGTNLARYHKYQEKICAEVPKEEFSVAIRRTANAAFTVSGQAEKGSGLFRKIFEKSIAKSANVSRRDQAYRKYDFTRLKLKGRAGMSE